MKKPFSIYSTWGLHDELGDNVELSEELVFADQLTRLSTIMSGKDISTYKTLNNLRANGIILAFKLIAGKKTWLEY